VPRLTITTIPRSSLIRGLTQGGGHVQAQRWGGKMPQRRRMPTEAPERIPCSLSGLTPHWTPLLPCPSHTTAAFSSACLWESPILSSVFFSSCPITPFTSPFP
uniref:Uncharacterized protein n=1 Tax=Gorilla gorilla gorilla TaxID=9595 RepID=A0A2I2YCC5_GORGO